MMGDVKLCYGPRLRLDVRYPGKPARGLPEPAPEIPVHFMDSRLFIVCRKPGGAMRLKTSNPAFVTCPKCLKLLNLPFLQPPPCGSPAGDSGSMDAARDAGVTIHLSTMQDSSFGDLPASASCPGAGFVRDAHV